MTIMLLTEAENICLYSLLLCNYHNGYFLRHNGEPLSHVSSLYTGEDGNGAP